MPRPTTMNLSEAVAISASSLWAHKLRSVLTLIGVVIGVAAVIAVVSLINGANQYVATRVFRLGADVFGLSKQPSIITNVDDWLEFQKRKRLTYDDFEAVRDLCKSCKEIGASLGGRVEVKSGLNSLKDTNLRAWTPRSEEHTSELQSQSNLVCRLLLEKKKTPEWDCITCSCVVSEGQYASV